MDIQYKTYIVEHVKYHGCQKYSIPSKQSGLSSCAGFGSASDMFKYHTMRYQVLYVCQLLQVKILVCHVVQSCAFCMLSYTLCDLACKIVRLFELGIQLLLSEKQVFINHAAILQLCVANL